MLHSYTQTELDDLLPGNDVQMFYKGPVKAYDPAYTRDIDSFTYSWNRFRKGMRSYLLDALSMKDLHRYNILMDLFIDTVQRIRYAERKQHLSLISRTKTDGTLHVSGSYFRLLSDI